jgi:hypothetical protein
LNNLVDTIREDEYYKQDKKHLPRLHITNCSWSLTNTVVGYKLDLLDKLKKFDYSAYVCALLFNNAHIIKEFFDEFKNKKTISDYLSARDNIADDRSFYLCLKNVNFIDCIRNTNNDIPCPTKINCKRPKIDNNLRDLVWNTYIGSDCKKGKCYCCPRTIDYTLFECGHLKSHKNGGKTDLKNLRPFCFHCNRSLGSNDFIEKINKSI